MCKEKPFPPHCLVVHAYSEFRSLVRAFATGSYQFMCIIGGPGLGKSEIVKRTMQEALGASGWGLLKGKHTPLDLYERIYRFRTVPVVFDDLDDLLRKAENIMMLKCLCDTSPVKRVEWGSKHASFASGLPQSFDSISRVCLISNDWRTLDRNIAALYDRGPVIYFQTSAIEVHKELAGAGWFDDEEVFRFIGRNLFLIVEPSFRIYQIARDHKLAGLDWQDLTLRTIQADANPKTILVARILADPHYDQLTAPEAARAQAFADLGGGTRATYNRFKALLLAQRGEIDPAMVEATELQPRKQDLHYLAQLDRRQQLEQMRPREDDEPSTQVGQDEGPIQSIEMISRLQRALDEAVKQEDFGQAAKLRDEIRRIQRAGLDKGSPPPDEGGPPQK